MVVLNIERFGASPGRDSTSAIANAIANAQVGDTVLVPPGGVYLTRPFNISKDDLTLQVDGVLRAHARRARWPTLPPLPSYGMRDRDGAKKARHQALVFLHAASRLVIRGAGELDGYGPWWWNARHAMAAGRPHL